MKEAKQMSRESGYCQAPSNQYMRWLDEAMDDPRVVSGRHPDADWRVPYRLAPSKRGITIKGGEIWERK